MRVIKIKNLQETADSYCGMEIPAGTYYTLQSEGEVSSFNNDLKVNEHLFSVPPKILIADEDTDLTGMEAKNWLAQTSPVDSDYAPLVRMKINTSGWHFQDRYLQFTTSKLNSVVNLNSSGVQRSDAWAKFYDAEGVELTTQETIDSSCVKTVLDVEPQYDYEVIEGGVFVTEKPAVPVYVGVVMAPDIPAQYGGGKCILSGADLSQKDEYEIEGRAVKKLYYNATNHSNKLRAIVIHPVGYQLTLNFDIDHFKE